MRHRLPLITLRFVLAVLVVFTSLSTTALAVTLKSGDLVITNRIFGGGYEIVVVDGTTGFQTAIPFSTRPYDVAIDADLQILVTVADGSVRSLDPVTSIETTLWPGLDRDGARAIDIEATGDLMVTHGSNTGTYRVDPATGVSAYFAGPAHVNGVTVAADGTIYLTPDLGQSVHHYDPSGTLLDSFDMSVHPEFNRPAQLDQLPSGEIVVASEAGRGLYLLNPANGANTLLSDMSAFDHHRDEVFVTRGGKILITGNLLGDLLSSVYEIDRTTGAPTLVVGGGLLDSPTFLAVVETRPCDDGVDNDGDGDIDGADSGCADVDDFSEEPDCSDGLDNDNDDHIDSGDDPGCTGPSDTNERDDSLVCDDGFDNDGDGAVDGLDPGCDDAFDDDEQSPLIACDNGVDDDNDGETDFPADPGCVSLADVSENLSSLECDNGLDDDGDTLTDFPSDPGCADLLATQEDPECDDNFDNDNDGDADWDGGSFGVPADPGCASAASDEEGPECDDGLDNDADGGIDWDGGLFGAAPDAACITPVQDLEGAACDDDIDNDGDAMIDWDGGSGGALPDPACDGPERTSEHPTRWAALQADGAALAEFLTFTDLQSVVTVRGFQPLAEGSFAESMASDGIVWVLYDADDQSLRRYASAADVVAGNSIQGAEPITPAGFESIATDGDVWVLFDVDGPAIVRYPTLGDLMNDTNQINGLEPIGATGYQSIAENGVSWVLFNHSNQMIRYFTLQDLIDDNRLNGVEAGGIGLGAIAGIPLVPAPEPYGSTALGVGLVLLLTLYRKRATTRMPGGLNS